MGTSLHCPFRLHQTESFPDSFYIYQDRGVTFRLRQLHPHEGLVKGKPVSIVLCKCITTVGFPVTIVFLLGVFKRSPPDLRFRPYQNPDGVWVVEPSLWQNWEFKVEVQRFSGSKGTGDSSRQDPTDWVAVEKTQGYSIKVVGIPS